MVTESFTIYIFISLYIWHCNITWELEQKETIINRNLKVNWQHPKLIPLRKLKWIKYLLYCFFIFSMTNLHALLFTYKYHKHKLIYDFSPFIYFLLFFLVTFSLCAQGCSIWSSFCELQWQTPVNCKCIRNVCFAAQSVGLSQEIPTTVFKILAFWVPFFP